MFRELLLIDSKIDESGFQQWRGDSARGPALDEVAQDVVGLDGGALAQIAIHRGRQLRSRRSHGVGVS